MAKATGNAANRPRPPKISQVSLPSQIGAIEFMTTARSAGSGTKVFVMAIRERADRPFDLRQSHKVRPLATRTTLFLRRTTMDFEQTKKVLQLTETRIKKFGSIDTPTSDEIQKAFLNFSRFNGW